MRFRTEQHLRRQSDIRAAREQGSRLDCRAFTVWRRTRLPGETVDPLQGRAAMVASIAAVGGAVKRNRAKRRLREVFRQHQALVPAGSDLVLVARAAINRLDYLALEQKFTDACRKFSPPSHA